MIAPAVTAIAFTRVRLAGMPVPLNPSPITAAIVCAGMYRQIAAVTSPARLQRSPKTTIASGSPSGARIIPIGIEASAVHRKDRRSAGMKRDRSLAIRAKAGKMT